MENHETDYQRKRRQNSETRKYGVTGSTPEDAIKRIKKHIKQNPIDKALQKKYINHLPNTLKTKSRGIAAPKDYYENEVKELKSKNYKGSISFQHLKNKAKIKDDYADVRGSRAYLEKAGIKNKEAYAEQATHKKGKWMIHYK